MVVRRAAADYRNSSLEVSYLGSAGVHLQRLLTYNTATPGPPTNINNRRPLVSRLRRHVPGNGRSLPFHLSRAAGAFPAALQPRMTFLSSYSWSKSIDNGSGIRTVDGDSLTPSNDHNLRLDRDFPRSISAIAGPPLSCTNCRSAGAKLLGGGMSRWPSALIGGWQIGGIVYAAKRLPLYPILRKRADPERRR